MTLDGYTRPELGRCVRRRLLEQLTSPRVKALDCWSLANRPHHRGLDRPSQSDGAAARSSSTHRAGRLPERRNVPVPATRHRRAEHGSTVRRANGEHADDDQTRVVAWGLWLATMSLCGAGGNPGRDPARDRPGADRGSRVRAGVPARLCHRGAGAGAAAAGQPDRLAVRRLGALIWSLTIPFDPWVDQLILDHRPLLLTA